MNLARRCVLSVAVVVMTMAGGAWAQVATLLPANTLVAFKVANLDATSKKIADLATSLGLAQMLPPLSNPLDSFLQQMGDSQGINHVGDMAVAMVDPDSVGGDVNNSGLVLLPVSDYAAFVAALPDAKTDGDVTQSHFKDDTTPVYFAHWGDFVAAGPSKDLISTKPTTSLEMGTLAAKEWDAKDATIYVNIKALRAKALPKLDQLKQQASDFIDQQSAAGAQNPAIQQALGGVDVAKLAPLMKVIVTQVLVYGQKFLSDADDGAISAKLSSDGIGISQLVEFAPDSYFGKAVAQVKNTDASLMTGLPEGKYLMFGGSVGNPQVSSQILGDFLAPIEKSITDLGPDFAPAEDMITAIKAYVAAQTGSTFGMLAPSGMIGTDPLFQIVGIRTGDSKAIKDATHKMFDAMQALKTSLGAGGAMAAMTQTYTPDAKTVDGVSFDNMQTTFQAGHGPGGAQTMQMMTLMYGPAGMNQYYGCVDDKTFVVSFGLSDPALTATIEAIKSQTDTLSKVATVKSVSDQLPTQRVAEFYLPLDMWASTGLLYAKQFAMDMGVKIPEDLPPIGATISVDGSATRADAYIPAQLIQSLTSAGMQMYMMQHQQQQPGAGGGPGGGGL